MLYTWMPIVDLTGRDIPTLLPQKGYYFTTKQNEGRISLCLVTSQPMKTHYISNSQFLQWSLFITSPPNSLFSIKEHSSLFSRFTCSFPQTACPKLQFLTVPKYTHFAAKVAGHVIVLRSTSGTLRYHFSTNAWNILKCKIINKKDENEKSMALNMPWKASCFQYEN